MEKTGESYTAARAVLLAGKDQPAEQPWLATSDERIRERTGRGWEEWFDLLDEWGAAERTHRGSQRGGPDEGVLARARHHAEGGAGAMRHTTTVRVVERP